MGKGRPAHKYNQERIRYAFGQDLETVFVEGYDVRDRVRFDDLDIEHVSLTTQTV